MKITLSWLKSHLKTDKAPQEISNKLIQLGHEVEEVVDTQAAYEDFYVVKILSAEPHPNADSLQICKVGFGDNRTEKVVCRASNAKPGLITVYAGEGVYIPALEKKLKKAKIRGVESCGMLCSSQELGLETDSRGIIDLGSDFEEKLGKSFATARGERDFIFDISLTPNRSDCFSVRGLARDLSCASMGDLKELPESKVSGKGTSSVNVHIDKAAKRACPHFTGRLIQGVKNKPSPEWLKKLLKSVGLKSISTLVDITNYFCHDQGRPLHVFDADKLHGDLKVRLAKKGESFKALDGESYTLDEGMLVIDDTHEIVSLAGVMGGLDSGCSDDTVNVFLESAYFDPKYIAKAGQKLNIISDARTRFERGIDPKSTLQGLNAATEMILDLCGGTASDLICKGEAPVKDMAIDFQVREVEKIAGYKVEESRCCEIFSDLGCHVKKATENRLIVTPPSWRHDIKIKEDLIEEVMRIVGYDNISLSPMPIASEKKIILNRKDQLIECTKRYLAQQGLMETVSYTFLPKSLAQLFPESSLEVTNPISEDLKYMRSTLISGLVDIVGRNLSRKIDNLQFFQIGACFQRDLSLLQETKLGAVYSGATAPNHWSKNQRSFGVQEAKADLEGVLELYGIKKGNYQIIQEREKLPVYMHPGKTAIICQGPKRILGYFGKLHPKVLKSLDIKQDIFCFEIYLERLPTPKALTKKSLSISSFQPVERDLAIIVDEKIPAEILQDILIKVDKNLVQWVDIFDVYQGQGVEPGKKSIAFRIRLQANDHTLTEDELKNYHDTALQHLAKKTGATLR